MTACVYTESTETGSVRYALYDRVYRHWQVGYSDQSFVMSFGVDQKMYRVSGLPSSNYPPLYAANFDGFIYHYQPSTSLWGPRLDIFKYIHSKLIKTSSNSYHFNTTSPDFTFKRPNGYILPTGGAATSPNGKWLVFEAIGIGVVRLNLEDFQMKRVSTFAGSYGAGLDPSVEFAISNDGEDIFVGGLNAPFELIHVTDSCGDMSSVTDTISKSVPIVHPCNEKNLGQYVVSRVNKFRAVTDLAISNDGGELNFTIMSWSEGSVRASLAASGYKKSALEYLAMGDSYSSGEGDISMQSNGSRYYLPMTDAGFDRCHVSSRSYPFLLRDYLTVSSDKMKSVACSGARVVLDYARSNNGYFGEGNRLLKQPNIEELKDSALNNFIPGRVPQLEFVKKYQPDLVTLTGGGNDIGFADVIKYCASPDLEMIVIDDTCGYAIEGSDLRQMLGRSIRDQYAYTTRLLKEIHAASPNTKVYVVGYPSFIAGSMASCALNSGILNGRERDMINEGISYVNAVLKQAADTARGHYIDIQNSLNGGRMCEGSEYVTGTWDIHFDIKHQQEETFHPNPSGHYAIAQTIIHSGDFSLDPTSTSVVTIDKGAPAIPEYFGVTDNTTTEQHTISINSVLVRGAKALLHLAPYGLQPDSIAHVALHSDPLELGTFTAQNDGSFEAEVTIPASLQPGYHVLTLKGFSPSGEPIEYYQFIEVQSGISSDADDDGIPDSTDRCNYIAHWYDESTGVDTCAPIPEQTESGGSGTTAGHKTPKASTQPSVKAAVLHSKVLTHSSLEEPTIQDVKGVQTSRVAALPVSTEQIPITMILAGAAVVVVGTAGIVYGATRRRKHDNIYQSHR